MFKRVLFSTPMNLTKVTDETESILASANKYRKALRKQTEGVAMSAYSY